MRLCEFTWVYGTGSVTDFTGIPRRTIDFRTEWEMETSVCSREGKMWNRHSMELRHLSSNNVVSIREYRTSCRCV